MKACGCPDKRKSEKSLSNSRSTEEERGADAPALGADEGRDKLRKSAGSRTWAVIRGCPNGGTRQETILPPAYESIVCGREPGELKHLSSRRKRKKHRLPK